MYKRQASGGPFLGWGKKELAGVQPAQALKHPNWKMGAKVTIDSATLMNKGFEVLEARWLFDLQLSQVDVVIHPQSIVHSMVEYIDGSIIAQMGLPSMLYPIQYALSYPETVSYTHLCLYRCGDFPAWTWQECHFIHQVPPRYLQKS